MALLESEHNLAEFKKNHAMSVKPVGRPKKS